MRVKQQNAIINLAVMVLVMTLAVMMGSWMGQPFFPQSENQTLLWSRTGQFEQDFTNWQDYQD